MGSTFGWPAMRYCPGATIREKRSGQRFGFPVALQPPFGAEFVQGQRHAPLFQIVEDEFAAGDGVWILASLALAVGIQGLGFSLPSTQNHALLY